MSKQSTLQIARRGLGALGIVTWLFVVAVWSSPQHADRTDSDNQAMRQFEYHLGEWGPPPEDQKNQGSSIVYEWGIPGKTVKIAEYRVIDGKKIKVTEGLIGYHYGKKQILYQEFVLDGVRPFEAMYTGRYWFEDGNVMKREFTAFDPDTTSRAYRETALPVNQNTRKLLIEYRADDGQWKKWGEFTSVRKQAQDGQKPERKEIPTKYFEAFIGEWEAPADVKEKRPELKGVIVTIFEWGSHKRPVRILEGCPVNQKDNCMLEGFSFWNPVTGRVEFYANNNEADLLFKGEYTLLEKDKLQLVYEVHYPNDHDFAKRGHPIILFKHTYSLRNTDTIDQNIMYYNKKDNRWDPWGGDNGNSVMVRRKAQPSTGAK